MMRRGLAILGYAILVLVVSVVGGRLFDRYPSAFPPTMALIVSLLVVLLVAQWVARKRNKGSQ
jgi:amino acid permease